MKDCGGVRLFVAAVLSISAASAVPPAIGIASAVGSFTVNSIRVDGNANLFDGSQVRTGKASSQILLQSGAALTLGIDSAATLYRDHLLLQSGAAKVDGMNGFAIHAADYRIEQGAPSSEAVVRLESDTVEVAALTGSLNVLGQHGALLTHVGAGTAAAFQTGASGGPISPNNNNRKRQLTAETLLLAAVLTGLGLAVNALVQSPSTSP